jgi:hypothetical protein
MQSFKLASAAAAFLISASAMAAPEVLPVSPPAAAPRAGGANLGSAQLYASLSAAGALIDARSKGALPCVANNCRITSPRLGFRVLFARDVSTCAVSAISEGASYIPNFQRGGPANSVDVFFFGVTANDFVYSAFNMIVTC